MKDHLQKQVAKLVLEIGHVAALDGVGDLVRLFDRIVRDGRKRLLDVPGAAAVRIAQARHDAEQALQFRRGLALFIRQRYLTGRLSLFFRGHPRSAFTKLSQFRAERTNPLAVIDRKSLTPVNCGGNKVKTGCWTAPKGEFMRFAISAYFAVVRDFVCACRFSRGTRISNGSRPDHREPMGMGRNAAKIGCAALAICAAFCFPRSRRALANPRRKPAGRRSKPVSALDNSRAPIPSALGDSKITVLRIDPARFKLALYSAKAMTLPSPLTIRGWIEQQHLVAAINAGMFDPDGSTTGYARTGTITVKSAWKPSYGALLALGPDDPKLPAAAILDTGCDDVKAREPHYGAALQSLRMIDCKGANVWQQSDKAWSTAALAIDGEGRVLFIHARSPWSVHDFIANLQKLPLGIARAMYLEGGPEASLSVRAGGVSLDAVGSYETGFNENDDNTRQWELPNVIGVTRIETAR